jgi:hypothetical protein
MNSHLDSPNYKKKAKKFSTAKPTKKTAKKDSEEPPMKSSATTDVQLKHVKDHMALKALSTNTLK